MHTNVDASPLGLFVPSPIYTHSTPLVDRIWRALHEKNPLSNPLPFQYSFCRIYIRTRIPRTVCGIYEAVRIRNGRNDVRGPSPRSQTPLTCCARRSSSTIADTGVCDAVGILSRVHPDPRLPPNPQKPSAGSVEPHHPHYRPTRTWQVHVPSGHGRFRRRNGRGRNGASRARPASLRCFAGRSSRRTLPFLNSLSDTSRIGRSRYCKETKGDCYKQSSQAQR
jgi:hypothetical protein